MSDREQQLRERAYRIWEDEGRVDGFHEDHWKRAEEQHERNERKSDDITRVNEKANRDFAKDDDEAGPGIDTRPPSTVAPD